MFDQTMSQINQLNDALDQLAEGKEDLQDALKDLEHIMRYTSAQLALSIVQLTDSVALIEDQIALIDKSIAVYELQEKLGMATTINVDTQRTSKLEAQNQLRDTQEQLDNLKRSLNQLIGRPVNNELNVVPMELSGVIEPAPAFTPELINEFVKVNPDMITLLEEREDLKDSVKSGMGSDEKQDIEYQIQAKDMELKKQRQTAEDDLKAMIATMNKNATNYRISKDKLATEQKNFAIAQKKFELGMISQMQLMQNELALAQAELTNLSNGYQHYFDWQQFKLARQGIALNTSGK
jgi:outer membrane protein TolC